LLYHPVYYILIFDTPEAVIYTASSTVVVVVVVVVVGHTRGIFIDNSISYVVTPTFVCFLTLHLSNSFTQIVLVVVVIIAIGVCVIVVFYAVCFCLFFTCKKI
jgi:hypothetical protein